MSRTVHTTLDAVSRWMDSQAGRELYWAICPDNGRPREDGWTKFYDASELPRGRKLLIRPDGAEGKGGVHVHLPAELASTGTDPVVQSQREALRRDRENFLREREEFFTYREERLAALDEMAENLERRVMAHSERLDKDRELHAKEVQATTDLRKQVDEMMRRAQHGEEVQAIAASAVYSVDKLVGILALRSVRKMEDLPPSLVSEFQDYLRWAGVRRYYDHLPHAEKRFVADFMRLSQDSREATMKAIVDAMRAEKAQAQSEP